MYLLSVEVTKRVTREPMKRPNRYLCYLPIVVESVGCCYLMVRYCHLETNRYIILKSCCHINFCAMNLHGKYYDDVFL